MNPLRGNKQSKYFSANRNTIEDSSKDWAISYGDLMSLVLIFFMVLYSANLKKVESIHEKKIVDKKDKDIQDSKKLSEIKENLEKAAIGQYNIFQHKGYLEIIMDDSEQFEIGSIALKNEFKNNLNTIVTKLNELKEPIYYLVEGHSDRIKISPSLRKYYPSNWELSGARAATVVRYIQSQGVPASQLVSIGYAASRIAKRQVILKIYKILPLGAKP